MPVKAFTIPIVVPSNPTNGAVEPTVAMTPMPRLKSASVMSIHARRRAPPIDVAEVIVARSESSGFTS